MKFGSCFTNCLQTNLPQSTPISHIRNMKLSSELLLIAITILAFYHGVEAKAKPQSVQANVKVSIPAYLLLR